MFTVQAERWTGNNHRYIVGVFEDYHTAVQAIKEEYKDRAAKYNRFYLEQWEVGSRIPLGSPEIFDFPNPYGESRAAFC